MADKKKQKTPPKVSPRGKAHYPWLNKADDTLWENGVKKGNDPKKGKYKTGLILHKTDEETLEGIRQKPESNRTPEEKSRLADAAFIAGLLKAHEDAQKSELARLTKEASDEGLKVQKKYPKFFDNKGEFREASLPFKENPQNDKQWIVSFAMNAQYEKDNKTVYNKPSLYDSKLAQLPADVIVGGGSEIRVSYYIKPFSMANVGAGISLKMVGVQVLKLERFGQRSAADLGFSQEEGESIQSEGGNEDTGFSADEDNSGGGSDGSGGEDRF